MRKPKKSRQAAARRAPAASSAKHADPTLREIYAIVRAIPRGRVATYGQLAELAGLPSGHRIVARAMRSCPSGLPWQRVVGKKDARRAQINIQHPDHGKEQRTRLAAEGVAFDAGGFIVLERFGWLPR
jgi:methylated-DNA-protein-cysteine methyltransferase-like protein